MLTDYLPEKRRREPSRIYAGDLLAKGRRQGKAVQEHPMEFHNQELCVQDLSVVREPGVRSIYG